jgi:hypothetical protein
VFSRLHTLSVLVLSQANSVHIGQSYFYKIILTFSHLHRNLPMSYFRSFFLIVAYCYLWISHQSLVFPFIHVVVKKQNNESQCCSISNKFYIYMLSNFAPVLITSSTTKGRSKFYCVRIKVFLSQTLYTQITNSMEQSPSWEANSFLASQEIPRIL